MSPNRVFMSLAVLLGFGGLTQLALADTVNVSTSGVMFDPADVTIEVGDSVHWTELFGGFHNVAEVDDAADNTWNGGFRSSGGSSEFTHTFNTQGVFFYICEPHVFSNMRGTVTVQAGPPTGACCDASTGNCDPDILQANCQVPLAWTEGMPCAAVVCEAPVPAVSTWGMIGLIVLVIAAAGVIVVNRRRRLAA